MIRAVATLLAGCLASAVLFSACGGASSDATASAGGSAGSLGTGGAGGMSGAAGLAGRGGSSTPGGGTGGTGAGKAGAAGHAGGAGHAGTGGKAGGGPVGGTGGIGGAGAAAGAAGAPTYAQPIWKPVAGASDACADLEYLANPADIGPMFGWTTCSSPIPGCQQLAFTPNFQLPAQHLEANAAYEDDSGRWLVVWTDTFVDDGFILVARDDGLGVAALHTKNSGKCVYSAPIVGNGHFALGIDSEVDASTVREAVIVGALDAAAVPALSPFGQPVDHTSRVFASGLHAGRAFVRNGPGLSLWSVDWNTAADHKLEASIYSLNGEIYDIGDTPDRALFFADTTPRSQIFTLDPVAPPSVYLTDPVGDLFYPRFTGQHLTWLKALDRIDEVDWNTIEIWGSPYAATADGLQPMKIAKWPWKTTCESLVAGQDYLGVPTNFNVSDQISFHAFHIPDGVHRRVEVAPAYRVDNAAGLWKDEAVFSITQKDNFVWTLSLYRVPFESMTVVP